MSAANNAAAATTAVETVRNHAVFIRGESRVMVFLPQNALPDEL